MATTTRSCKRTEKNQTQSNFVVTGILELYNCLSLSLSLCVKFGIGLPSECEITVHPVSTCPPCCVDKIFPASYRESIMRNIYYKYCCAFANVVLAGGTRAVSVCAIAAHNSCTIMSRFSLRHTMWRCCARTHIVDGTCVAAHRGATHRPGARTMRVRVCVHSERNRISTADAHTRSTQQIKTVQSVVTELILSQR